MDLFEECTRRALRFPSSRGALTVEQLWEMPLVSKDNFNLDNVAKAINGELKQITEESFVEVKPHPLKKPLTIALDICKHIIAFKLEEQEKRKAASERSKQRAKLLDALELKETEEMAGKSKKQLLKELDALEEATE